ncbi:MAG: hypothetical protein MUF52_11915 [Syntrophobacteraceae bacterium]|nr:hypothetical protein [Syntrophobacteraceae bacterium]
MAGICDDKQRLCFALALWNGRDPIIKERLFGLTNAEGNHGEDVKEYYFYLDNTPSHAYMKCLNKYPQKTFPYADLVDTNGSRNRHEMEYELLDTGVFDEDRYFDVFVEYALADPEDILIRITVANRGPEPAHVHVLPHLWFRNTWSWLEGAPRPELKRMPGSSDFQVIAAGHPQLGDRFLACENKPALVFTENETNHERLFGGNSNWRGPIWLPVNTLIIRALLGYYLYYGDRFRIECPTGSGHTMNLFEVAREIANRLSRIFLRDEQGRRPLYGGTEKFQNDPHWRDYILFHEYFHGDNGAGLGASHQTGWTGIIAKTLQMFASLDPRELLETGRVGPVLMRSR